VGVNRPEQRRSTCTWTDHGCLRLGDSVYWRGLCCCRMANRSDQRATHPCYSSFWRSVRESDSSALAQLGEA
jgi:hypothetical protein